MPAGLRIKAERRLIQEEHTGAVKKPTRQF
jgi:hypothetical protein